MNTTLASQEYGPAQLQTINNSARSVKILLSILCVLSTVTAICVSMGPLHSNGFALESRRISPPPHIPSLFNSALILLYNVVLECKVLLDTLRGILYC